MQYWPSEPNEIAGLTVQFLPAISSVRNENSASHFDLNRQKICVVLHGKGDSIESYFGLNSELSVYGLDYLLVQAPYKFIDGFKWMNNEPHHLDQLISNRWLLSELIDHLFERGYRSEEILWLGHSQGGRVISDFLFQSEHNFIGFVGVSTYLGFQQGLGKKTKKLSEQMGARLNMKSKTPWLITHGRFDRVIPVSEIRSDLQIAEQAGVNYDYLEFPKGHDFDYHEEVPMIRSWIEAQLYKEQAPHPNYLQSET